MEVKLVSIIIPTYNREKTIRESVCSVLDQSYGDIEVIVVDDGSTDHTKEVLEDINDNRLRYIFQTNSGACNARNHGIKEARGEYIAFQDSDDLWHKDKLKKQIQIIESGKAKVVFCKKEYYLNGIKQVDRFQDRFRQGIIKKKDGISAIGTQCILGKREVFEKHIFDVKLPRYQDLDLLLRIWDDYDIYCLDEKLVDYYVSKDSISSDDRKLFFSFEYLMRKYPEFKNTIDAKYMVHVVERQIHRLMMRNDPRYKIWLQKVNRYCPSIKRTCKVFLNKMGLYKAIYMFYKKVSCK